MFDDLTIFIELIVSTRLHRGKRMTLTSVVPRNAPERRIRLTHHLLALRDGHEVGVSVGGAGVPLVFMHGLALSRRAYVRMLSVTP